MRSRKPRNNKFTSVVGPVYYARQAELGLLGCEVAKRAGINHGNYSRYILQRQPTVHNNTHKKICEALKIDHETLESNITKHIWEYRHSSHIGLGRCDIESFDSWDEYMRHAGNINYGLNLLVRWDWDILNNDLTLAFFKQRKGTITAIMIENCTKDLEPQIRNHLELAFNHLLELWEPFSNG